MVHVNLSMVCLFQMLTRRVAYLRPGNLYGDCFIRNDKDPGALINQNFSLFMLHDVFFLDAWDLSQTIGSIDSNRFFLVELVHLGIHPTYWAYLAVHGT